MAGSAQPAFSSAVAIGVHMSLASAPIRIASLVAVSVAVLFCTLPAQAKSTTESIGDVANILIPATAYASTFAMDDKAGRSEFYRSFFSAAGLTYVLKHAVHKSRPEHNGSYSFPSGHTSASFQGAAFIQRRYGWKWGIAAYVAAAYVGWSRIEGESDKHDLTDVAAGAAIGILSSYCFTTSYNRYSVSPWAEDGAYGLGVSRSW
jgi:membrane-associated phospholipid phosphatase